MSLPLPMGGASGPMRTTKGGAAVGPATAIAVSRVLIAVTLRGAIPVLRGSGWWRLRRSHLVTAVHSSQAPARALERTSPLFTETKDALDVRDAMAEMATRRGGVRR